MFCADGSIAAGVEAVPAARGCSKRLQQARNKRSDTRMLVRVGDCEVRRYRGLLLLKPVDDAERDPFTFQWQGEDELPLPGWGGVLKFSRVGSEGFDPAWLRERAA